MKKTTITLLVTIICLISQGFGEKEAWLNTSIQSSDVITASMLNNKPAVYKTYGDFINGKPEKLEPIKIKYMWSVGVMRKFGLLCKDESGKKVELDCDDFWGWRDDDGLYRCIPYRVGKITSIAVIVNYVDNDYVEYGQPIGDAINFKPGRWYSTALGGKMYDLDRPQYRKTGFKLDTHTKEKYHKYISAAHQ